MAISFTARGRIELRRQDGSVISTHILEREAVERASTLPSGTYRIVPPPIDVVVSDGVVTIVPVSGRAVLSSFGGGGVAGRQYFPTQIAGSCAVAVGARAAPEQSVLTWTSDLPSTISIAVGSFFDLEPYIYDPQGDATVSLDTGDSLPTGMSLAQTPTRRIVNTSATVGASTSNVNLVLTPSAETDWQSRISAAGVVWYHDFRSDAEVNRFRWQGGLGNDLNGTGDGNCRRITTDGITGGGCLEINIPAGGTSAAGWSRPFSPLTAATNGRGIADPGASPLAWNVSHGTDYLGQWKNGFYTHADYQGSWPTWGFGGTEFWIQFRVKISANRAVSGQPNGKLAFIGVTGNGTSHFTPTQEIVVQSLQSRILRAYTNFGNGFNSALTEPQAASDSSGTIKQPGGAYQGTCINNLTCSICWCYPMDEWVTVLVHVRPGHHGTSLSQTAAQDTLLEIKVARAGETSYTTIYSKADFVFNFQSGTPQGWSAFEPSGYMNGVASLPGQGWTQRFDQVIFSTQPIACPQV